MTLDDLHAGHALLFRISFLAIGPTQEGQALRNHFLNTVLETEKVSWGKSWRTRGGMHETLQGTAGQVKTGLLELDHRFP